MTRAAASRALVALAAVALAGCKMQDEPVVGGGPGSLLQRDAAGAAGAMPAIAAPPAGIEAVLGRALAAAHQLAEQVAASAGDCGALAAALEALIIEHQPLLDELAGFPTDPGTAQRIQTWMAAHATELDGAIERARPLEACKHDARIKSAFERLSRLP